MPLPTVILAGTGPVKSVSVSKVKSSWKVLSESFNEDQYNVTTFYSLEETLNTPTPSRPTGDLPLAREGL
jgi:hypothetical protein